MRNLRKAKLGMYSSTFLMPRKFNLRFSSCNFRSHTYNHLYSGVNTRLISRTALNLYPTRYLTTGEESRKTSDEKLKETFTLSESTQEKPSLDRVDELLENLRGEVIGLKAQGIPALEDKFADLQDFVGAAEGKILELKREIEEIRKNIQNLKIDDFKSKGDAYTKRINMISAGLWFEFLLLLGGFISLYFAYDRLKQQLPPENLLKEIKDEVLKKECNNIKTDLKNTMAAVSNLEKNQEKLEKSRPGDTFSPF